MQLTIDETARRREKQLRYNAEHHITPQPIRKDIKPSELTANIQAERPATQSKAYVEPDSQAVVADPIIMHMTREQMEKSIANTTRLMKQAAKQLDFMQAAQYRDEILRMQAQLEKCEK